MHGTAQKKGFNDSVCVNLDGQNLRYLISSGNYTGDTFATELQGLFNALRANVFTVRYNNSKNNITISVVGSTTFKILTDDEAELLFNTRNTINSPIATNKSARITTVAATDDH